MLVVNRVQTTVLVYRREEKALIASQFSQLLTLLMRMVIPRYLKGFVNSSRVTLSGVMVIGATERSAMPVVSSPTMPVHTLVSFIATTRSSPICPSPTK